MRLTAQPDVGEFLARTQRALEKDEAANSLLLGIALRLLRAPREAPVAPYLATVAAGRELALAALMTPPYRLVLAELGRGAGRACKLLAEGLSSGGWPVPGALGPAAVAGAFARAWADLTGASCRLSMQQRVHRLDRVIPVPATPGRLRLATMDDAALAAHWTEAFHREVFGEGEPAPGEGMAREKIVERALYLWEDGRPVSMAAWTRPTAHGISVNLVYTPHELRGRGYATACVAGLSQLLLEMGWKFCTLFTDLANATSNRIYQAVGYTPVCDFDEYTFGAASS